MLIFVRNWNPYFGSSPKLFEPPYNLPLPVCSIFLNTHYLNQFKMTILVTGSRGITARRLTSLLHPKYPVLVATRSAPVEPTLPPSVVFDWTDESTYENPFKHPQAQESPISAMYIVAPTGEESVLAGELAFIEFAAKRGVTRFVHLGSSMIPEGGPFMGQVHARLRQLGVEWAVLRPSWFMRE